MCSHATVLLFCPACRLGKASASHGGKDGIKLPRFKLVHYVLSSGFGAVGVIIFAVFSLSIES